MFAPDRARQELPGKKSQLALVLAFALALVLVLALVLALVRVLVLAQVLEKWLSAPATIAHGIDGGYDLTISEFSV